MNNTGNIKAFVNDLIHAFLDRAGQEDLDNLDDGEEEMLHEDLVEIFMDKLMDLMNGKY